ncbi:MAG: maleylpyruvate isomerase family mycothiol-dependent enzyme [Acidimicrobiia bacterium]
MTVGHGEIYAETRERVTALVRSLSPEELAGRVPTTPDWSPRDIVGHLAGVAFDAVTGNIEGLGTDPWTAVQVDARRGMALEEVLAEWEGHSKIMEPVLDTAPPPVLRMIADCYLHEQDIRGAVGRPGARDASAVDVALDIVLFGLGSRLVAAGLPGLRFRAGEREWAAGSSPPGATVTAPDAYELLRCLYSRRSWAQVAALGWEGDEAERYVDTLGRFPFAIRDIVE